MKANEFVNEDNSDSGDYQQMLAFTQANRVGGVPDAQQIPLALFKELKKQQQQNQKLGAELDAAEQRIDQATQSGELSKRELGLHRGELDRERAAGEKQQAAVGQLGQHYAQRERASDEQMQKLTGQLEKVKNKPGVDPKATEELEKQIEQLNKKSVSVDHLSELESTISAMQQRQTVDDTEIQDLMAQIEQAQKDSKELKNAKQSASKEAEQTAADAIDQLAQMKQDLERLNRVAGEISAKSDAIPSQITSLNAKLKELDSESEHQYDELLKHDQLLNKLMPGSGGPTVQSNSPVPPAPPAPTAQPPVPSAPQLSAQSPERIAADAIARAQKRKNDIRQYAGQPEEFTAESRFNNLIKWATGKKP